MENKIPFSDLNYFKAALLNFINTYHPHLAGDRVFIEGKTEEAEELFFTRIHEGDNLLIAMEAAWHILFGDLNFSLYEITYDQLCDHFPQIPSDKRKEITLSILPEAENLLANYPGLEVDDSLRLNFEMELLGTICQYLDSHGIQ